MSAAALNIAVLGAGAMGSFFGGRLKAGGAEVTLIDVNQAHLDAISRAGLRLDTDQGSQTVRLAAETPGTAQGPFDLIVVFTKTVNSRAALDGVRHLVGPETVLLSLQNGLGNKEILLDFAPASRVLIGMTTYPADMIGPGHVSSHGLGKVRFMTSDSSDAPILDRMTAAFRAGGLDAAPDAQVEATIWEKVAFNAALNTIAATTRSTVGRIGRSPQARALAHRIATEVVTVANACGVAANDEAVHSLIDHALDTHICHKPSMLQDVLAGRPTEIDAIAGEAIRRAQAAGIAVPATEAMHALVLLATSD